VNQGLVVASLAVCLPAVLAAQGSGKAPPVLDPTADDAIILEYFYEDGQRADVEVAVETTFFRRDAPALSVEMTFRFHVSCVVEAAYADGSADILLTIDRLVSGRGRDPAAWYDSAVPEHRQRPEIMGWTALLEQPLRFIADPDGGIFDLITDPFVEAAAPAAGRTLSAEEKAALGDRVEFAFDPILKSLFPRVSWDPVRSGSSYDSGYRTVIVGDIGLVLVTTTHLVRSISRDHKLAVIGTSGRADTTSPGISVGSFSDEGWFLFDVANGRVLESYGRLSGAFDRGASPYSFDMQVSCVVKGRT
jgi:hypothetical protein